MPLEMSLLAQADAPTFEIRGLDIAVTVVYVVGIVILGCWAGLRHRHGGGEAKEYFLAGGTLRWPIIGLALFATNISCVHLVSLAQSGYDTGLLKGNFEWMAAFTLVLLGLFFAPFYIRSQVATLPDFLEKRYNRECRDWLAVLSIVSAVVVHIGFSFLTGGIVLAELFNIDMYTGIVVVAALTGLYTIIGGLMAVVITEAIQTVVLVVGAAVITFYAWDRMGGWEPMTDVLREQGEMAKLSMLRPHGDPDKLPWYAVFLGYPVLGIWYWCADQTIVQRVLGAQDEQHARVGPLFAGLIKVLPVFIFVLPGLFAFTLVQTGKLDKSPMAVEGQVNVKALMTNDPTLLDGDQLSAAEVFDAKSGVLNLDEARRKNLLDDATAATLLDRGETIYDSKEIYAVMITQLLPQGLVGLMVAALLAALMSTVAGALNSISTLFSYDLYRRFRPQASDHQLVLVGRITAGVALVAAIGLVPLLDGYPSIFDGLNDIIAHIAPPVTTVFVLGVFWRGASAQSAKLTLWLGSLLGAATYAAGKLGVKYLAEDNVIGEFLEQTPFMMKAFYLLCACVIMQVTFSFIYPVKHTEESEKLYWSTPWEPLRAKGWPGIGNYKLLSLLLIGAMSALYYFFR